MTGSTDAIGDDERADLRRAVRALLDKESGEEAVRATMDTAAGWNPDLWRTMAVELGLQGLAVDEVHGGSGAGWAEQAVVLEEAGRALLCAPYLATVGLAAPALVALSGSGDVDDHLAALAAGDLVATVALPDPGDVPAVTAHRRDGGSRLSGEPGPVLDAAAASLLLVPAVLDDGAVALFGVEAPAAGLTVRTPATSDRTRRPALLSFADTPAVLLGDPGLTPAVLDEVRHHAVIALACEQVGAAERVLADAVAYAGEREQFGRPIGSFQAVKHRLADMLVATETARSAAWAAVRALDTPGHPDLALVAAIARVACTETYVRVASDNVQVHGGIGYTWEHSAHLHVKRSRGSAALFGTPQRWRTLLGTLAPLPAPHPERTSS